MGGGKGPPSIFVKKGPVRFLLVEDIWYFSTFLVKIIVFVICRACSESELSAGVYMMLIISMLRYCATVHPLKPNISRRKLKIVCGLGYIFGLIVGYRATFSLCIIKRNDAWGV